MDKIIKTCTLILTAFMLAVIAGFIYLNYYSVKKPHITGAFIGNQVDPQTGIEKPLLEINYYTNGNEKGEEVVEFKINGLSESSKQTMYSKGAQLVGNKLYYYDYHNATGWESASPIVTGDVKKQGNSYVVDYQNATMFPIEIAGEKGNYAIALTGLYTTKEWQRNGWKVAGNILTLGLPLLFEGKNAIADLVDTTKAYTILDFLTYCKKLAKSQCNGYGDTYVDAIDLAEYFGVYKENGTNKYESIEMYDKTAQSRYYFSANIHYDFRGMQLAKQSLFGSVAGDGQYNKTGVDNIEYWRTDVNYKLSKTDLDLSYDFARDGYWLSIKDATLNKLNNYTANVVCDLNINLDDFDGKKILGIDFYGFNGVQFKNLNINSLIKCSFEVRAFGLKDCNISNFTKTDNVTLLLADNAYNGGDLI